MRASRLFVATVLAIAALTTAGCTGGPDPATTAALSTAPAPGLPPGVTQVPAVPSEIPNDPSARSAVAVTDCAAAPGGWRAAGTATNPSDEARSYTMSVFFTSSTATVLATGSVTVKVAKGAAAKWEVAERFTAPDSTRCVLVGVSDR